jgi:iron complex transport system permease protein
MSRTLEPSCSEKTATSLTQQRSALSDRSLFLMMLGLIPILLGILLFSLLVGAGDVSIPRAWAALMGADDPDAHFTVFQLRGVRTLLGLSVGIALGAAGTLLQAATRNPLAEPGLLGVSAGASFAVVIAIALGASAASVHVSVAIVGAVIGCMLVLLVSQVRGVGDDPVRLVLAGAAFSSLLMAFISLLLLYDQRAADEIRFWIIGALGGRPLDVLNWTAPIIAISLVCSLLIVRPLASLALGEQMATGLGHNPKMTRLYTLLIVAALVGAATSAAGPIAFVGLVVPFVARAFVGSDVRRTLWLSLLIGPILVVFADICSRLVVKPYELPIGVITALIGAPVLVMVVRSQRMPTL